MNTAGLIVLAGAGLGAALIVPKALETISISQPRQETTYTPAPGITTDQVYLTQMLQDEIAKQQQITEANLYVAQDMYQALQNAQSLRQEDIKEFQSIINKGQRQVEASFKEQAKIANPAGMSAEQVHAQAERKVKGELKFESALGGFGLIESTTALGGGVAGALGVTAKGASMAGGGVIGLAGTGLGWTLHKLFGNIGGGHHVQTNQETGKKESYNLSWFEKNVLGGPSPLHGWLGGFG